jgi:hypothetical protein
MDFPCFLVDRTGNMREIPCPCGSSTCKETRTVSEWKRFDTGETFFADSWELPIGSMYWWECMDVHHDEAGNEIGRYKGNGQWNNDDGRHLIVIVPGYRDPATGIWSPHRWDVDSRCNNCGSPNDRVHRCWVRHGEVPRITVGKGPGPSCNAGAGSIMVGEWHGFLQDGILRPC